MNENFYIGKQWEGVQSNGLPTPVFNFIKRVVGFDVATITSDNVKVTASPLANTANTDGLIEPVRIVNEEFDALAARNKISSLLREFARNAAVDGDGCLYTYWDADAETGQQSKGMIRTEIVENTRVYFGNPNDRRVQTQPWIMIGSREITRIVRRRAKENGMAEWQSISPDCEDDSVDTAKVTDDKTTVLLLLWRDEETGHIWQYEFTRNSGVTAPIDTKLSLYPVCWLSWDYVQDCYHGQSMVTGLTPNQMFVNKIWAAAMLSMLRTAFPKWIYDKTRIKRWDNGVGTAIGISGGDVSTVAKVIDPASISPQVAQFIDMAVKQTEECLGATSVALGDTRPDNTSAIIALQRAASTPMEMTKLNLYQAVEDLFRIYLDFMSAYYGVRAVDMEPTPEIRQQYEFAGMPVPDSIIAEFDFDTLKFHPMMLKLDVGASSYYSEIASIQTLDNLLMNGHINAIQYLERIPDGYIPARRALINELKATQAMNAVPPGAPPNAATGDVAAQAKPEIPTGGGFSDLQRKVLESGSTQGLI